LLKPGKLDASELEKIRQHCDYGYEIVGSIGQQQIDLLEQHSDTGVNILRQGISPVLRMAAVIALMHHERWDGSGYPRGLAGEAIPLEGRITSVADVFDALGSSRPYKPAFPLHKCLEIMESGRGTQFDPAVLDAFHAAREKILEIRREFADTHDRNPVAPTPAAPVETPVSPVCFTPSTP
jgi:putative two-component system response regulator